ncbi:MAG TPA: cation:proton antiporter, partial [Candidatus Krumholzibacteria bacterium]|nr:cation:proton antiporter [Candidatus Krumholzibacteria bacterium]
MEFGLLKDIFIIFGVAVAVAFVCHRLRIPTVVGLIIAGVIAGPYGLRLVGDSHAVEQMAELGIIFLLFTIGLEFSIDSVTHVKRLFFIAGPLQVIATAVPVLLLVRVAGFSTQASILLGLLASLSSTAIILKLLQSRSEVTSPHGKGTLAILIFQDVAFVPMMLLIPFLAGHSNTVNPWLAIALLLAKAAGIWLVIWLLAPRLVPRMLTAIARTGSNELFLLSIGVICFAVVWGTSLLGLSLALGAFLAGLILSDSEHSHRTLENVLPFRDVFSSFFFVSIGMLLDSSYVAHNSFMLIGVTALFILIKALASAGVMLGVGLPFRVSALAGLSLAQTGEFSLLVLAAGLGAGVFDSDQYQLILAVCLFSMVAAPFVVNLEQRIADFAGRLPMPLAMREGRYFISGEPDPKLVDHIVIAGYGVIGAMVGHSAKLCDIAYDTIEVDFEIVRDQGARGVPIFYGDATQEASLRKANLPQARVFVVAIPDPAGAARAVSLARRINPKVH